MGGKETFGEVVLRIAPEKCLAMTDAQRALVVDELNRRRPSGLASKEDALRAGVAMRLDVIREVI